MKSQDSCIFHVQMEENFYLRLDFTLVLNANCHRSFVMRLIVHLTVPSLCRVRMTVRMRLTAADNERQELKGTQMDHQYPSIAFRTEHCTRGVLNAPILPLTRRYLPSPNQPLLK
jgi:hypothetical protein